MLLLSILAPIVGSLLLAFSPNPGNSGSGKNGYGHSLFFFWVSLISSVVSLVASLYIAFDFNSASSEFQLAESWFSAGFAVDGLSLSLYILTTCLFPLGICFSYSSFQIQKSQSAKIVSEKLFWISLLILESSVIGVFVSTNLISFYVFWELVLIPMVLLIGIWGGENRRYASVKFFIYTFAGSVFLLLAIIAVAIYPSAVSEASVSGSQSITFEIADIMNRDLASLDIKLRRLIFWGFILSFLIKIPAFPFHTWLPHAHTQAPTVGSVILAGVLLKMGSYGIFRFSLDLFPAVSYELSTFFIVLGTIGIIYGAWLAWSQTDMKKLIAYSSVSHMGYILAGMFSGNQEGVSGAYIQMINHGISTGLLFLLVGMIYDRTHTRKLEDYRGLAKLSPFFAISFMIATLSSVGLPGTNGFVGEFLVLMGIYLANPVLGAFAVTGVIFGAVYMLHLYKKVFWGEPSEKLLAIHKKNKLNLKWGEVLIIVPFIVMIFWLGVKPSLVLNSSEKNTERLVTKMNQAAQATKTTQVTKVSQMEPADESHIASESQIKAEADVNKKVNEIDESNEEKKVSKDTNSEKNPG